MAKLPRAGRVKTRLANDVGTVAALRFYRSNLAATLRRLVAPARWTLSLAVTPDHVSARDFGLQSLQEARLIPQGPGDLGARIERLLSRASPPGRRIVIGADVPQITPDLTAEAFEALAGSDAVLGGAPDGGYWLIGLSEGRHLPKGALSAVRWSTAHAHADTLRALMNAGQTKIRDAAVLEDVDDRAAFLRLAPEAGRVVGPPRRH